jgi:NAD-dependent SIR2 family protein deacetylase
MHDQGKLVRCYTQNIDGIETREGLTIGGKEGQVCQLHGDIHTLRCDYCNGIHEYNTEWMDMLLDGEAPDCPECIRKCILPSSQPTKQNRRFLIPRLDARSKRKTIHQDRNLITQYRIIQ